LGAATQGRASARAKRAFPNPILARGVPGVGAHSLPCTGEVGDEAPNKAVSEVADHVRIALLWFALQAWPPAALCRRSGHARATHGAGGDRSKLPGGSRDSRLFHDFPPGRGGCAPCSNRPAAAASSLGGGCSGVTSTSDSIGFALRAPLQPSARPGALARGPWGAALGRRTGWLAALLFALSYFFRRPPRMTSPQRFISITLNFGRAHGIITPEGPIRYGALSSRDARWWPARRKGRWLAFGLYGLARKTAPLWLLLGWPSALAGSRPPALLDSGTRSPVARSPLTLLEPPTPATAVEAIPCGAPARRPRRTLPKIDAKPAPRALDGPSRVGVGPAAGRIRAIPLGHLDPRGFSPRGGSPPSSPQ